MLKKLTSKNSYFLFLVLIISLGVFLRFYNLGNESLWGDEINEVVIAGQNSISSIINTLLYFEAPPLDYIIVHIFLSFGKNEFVFRLPACVFGIFGIFMIFKIGKSTLNNEVGLISSFLLSTSIFHIAYSQEARMYALFCFLSMGSFLFLFRSLISGKNIFYILYIIFTLLSLYTHYFAIFILITQIIIFLAFAIFKFSKKDKKMNIRIILIIGKYFASIFIIFLLYIPLIRFIIRRITYKPISVYSDISISKYFNFNLIWGVIKGFSNNNNLIAYLFLILLIIGFFSIFKKEKAIFLFYSFWLFFPVFIILMFLAKTNNFFTTRYLIFILPAFLIIISEGISYLSKQIEKIFGLHSSKVKYFIPLLLITILITVFSIFPLKNYYLGNISHRIPVDWKSAGNFLNENVCEKDIIIVPTEGYGVDFLAFYFRPISLNHGLLRDSIFSEKDNLFFLTDKIPQNYIKSLNKYIGRFDSAWIVEWRNNKIDKEFYKYLEDKSSLFGFKNIRIIKVKSKYLYDNEIDTNIKLSSQIDTDDENKYLIYQSKNAIIKKIQYKKFINLNEFITFLGYCISSSDSILKRGKQIEISFYWECKKRLPQVLILWGGIYNQKNRNQFIDTGHNLGENPTNIKRLTTNYWHKGEIIIERITYNIPEEFDAGNYNFEIYLWDPSSKKLASKQHNIGIIQIE